MARVLIIPDTPTPTLTEPVHSAINISCLESMLFVAVIHKHIIHKLTHHYPNKIGL